MRSASDHFRRVYGAGPQHLLGMLICFAVIAYVFSLTKDFATAPRMAIWFIGLLLAHDLVLIPAYSLVDAGLRRLLGKRPRRRPGTRTAATLEPAPSANAAVPVLNYVRVPALASALLFLIFLPSITKQRPKIVMAASGLDQDPYLGRWLLLSAAFFLVSAVLYAIRRWRSPSSADRQLSPTEFARVDG